MKILITGASGFLGSKIMACLPDAEFISLGRRPSDSIIADIPTGIPTLPKTDLVIHAAGKAHVIPKTRSESDEFFRVNLEGTNKLLTALSESGSLPGTFVFISTVAVYGLETGSSIGEDVPLKGTTPYALSKIRAEESVLSWGKRYGVGVVILRLPLIVGKGAPGNLGAMVKHIRRGTYFRIGNGSARRSMVLATDLGRLIPLLAGRTGIYNLTDRIHPSIAEIDTRIAADLNKKVRVMPEGAAKLLARVGDLIPGSPFNTYRLKKLQDSLKFSDERAVSELGWTPNAVLSGQIT
jgi:nucleoside-diphosphate-sugar epimerase